MDTPNHTVSNVPGPRCGTISHKSSDETPIPPTLKSAPPGLGAEAPFNQMYKSFGFFSEMGKKWKSDFRPMSAGANWIPGCPVLVDALKRELDAGTTYRNYGRALGLRPVTDILATVEAELAGKRRSGLRVTITNGTSEGACLCLEALIESGKLKPGDGMFLVGHAYALYQLLADRFSLRNEQLLGDDDCASSFLPTMDRVLESLDSTRPRLISLLTPNNPLGENYTQADLSRLVKWCMTNDAVLLVDRVCQLPWDDRRSLMVAVEPGIVSGHVFVADSFSKSESFAGLRTGFLVSSELWQPTLERLTQHRSLNPIAFSTVTLAMSRLAELGTDMPRALQRLISMHASALYSEYPENEARLPIQEVFPHFVAQYAKEMEHRRSVIRSNFEALREVFGKESPRELLLTSGFNVALQLPQMAWHKEVEDQRALGNLHGVGVLTERCFRISRRMAGCYFIRVGLSLTEGEFLDGLERLRAYYIGPRVL